MPAGASALSQALGLQQDITPASLFHSCLVLPLEQPLLLLLPIYIRLYLLENTAQKGREMWESIFLPLVIKQSRVVSGFAELVDDIFFPVLFP